jgi:tetratricopeptide (TPR) repeat protein
MGTDFESIMYLLKGMGECSLGQMHNAKASFVQSAKAAQLHQQTEMGGGIRTTQAWCDAAVGFEEEARLGAYEALKLSADRDTRNSAALVLAMTGEMPRSQKLVDELVQQYPKDLLLNQAWVPTARAIQALHKSQPQEAIKLLEATLPYELGCPPDGVNGLPAFVRGEAYLRARDGAKAAEEYQKLLSHRAIDPVGVIFSLARLGLARAYVEKGDTPKARETYQDFFALWKNADPDVPILKQAKAEYAKLQ